MFVCYQVTIQSVSSSSIVSLHSWQTWLHGGTRPSRGWRDRDIVMWATHVRTWNEAEQSDTGSCWLCSTSSTARSSDTNQPPASDLVFSADIGENIAKYLAHIAYWTDCANISTEGSKSSNKRFLKIPQTYGWKDHLQKLPSQHIHWYWFHREETISVEEEKKLFAEFYMNLGKIVPWRPRVWCNQRYLKRS